MIKRSTFTGAILFFLLFTTLLATGEQHLPEDQRLFYFSQSVITIKNVCDDAELIAFDAFMPRNMFLYFKQQTNNGVITDYAKYHQALQNHKQLMETYLQNLEEKMATYNQDALNKYQIDFIRAKINRLAGYIHKLLKESDESFGEYLFHSGNEVTELGDSFNVFQEHSGTFEDLNDAFIFNLHKIIADASQHDLIRNSIQPAVCGNIIGSVVNIFRAYLNQENFQKLSQEKRVLLVSFFTEFAKHDFSAYECEVDDEEGMGAKSHLINQIYQTIYDKDLPEFSPENFHYFLDKVIPNTPTTPQTDFDGVKKMDHDIVHTYEKFNNLTLDDLLLMYQLRRPISIDFINFINDAEQEFEEMDVKVNSKPEEDVPLETFTTIYKAYIIGRSELPEDQHPLFEPLDGQDEEDDLPRIAKRLYFFIMQTKLFDPSEIPVEERGSDEEDPSIAQKARFGEFMDPNKFQKYRTLALIALSRKFTLKPKEFTAQHIPQLLDIIDKYNDPNEFVDSGDLGKYMPQEVVDKYHNQQAKAIFDKFEAKKDSIREKLQTFANRQKTGKKKKPKMEVLGEVFEDVEPEIQEIVNFTSISNPKENKATLAKKADMLVGMVENTDDDVDKFATLNIVSRALQTKILNNIPDEPKDKDTQDKKRLLATTLAKMNDKLINDLLIKIKSPGLYQFLTYISTQANLNDLKALGKIQKNSSDPDRANNLTLDKLIFLHRWYDVSKKNCVAKLQKGEKLDKNETVINNLVGPSAHFKNSLEMSHGNKRSRGVGEVYKHLLLTPMFLEYYPSLKFMAELIPLFERFSNIEHENPTERIHENYKEMFVTLYNIILDIRSDDLEMKGRKTIDVFLEKLHQIRSELLEAHISKVNEDFLTAKHSMTYKDVARVSYFAYYHMSLELGTDVFQQQFESEFGLKELAAKESQMEHNRYDFGGAAFELSNFLTYCYLHDRNFIRTLCVNMNATEDQSSIQLNGFCAQSMIFMNSMEFLSRSESGDFNAWIETVFSDEHFKAYVVNNKAIFYAALEMINRESNMLRTLHSERLSKLIDDEQARVYDLAQEDEEERELSNYEMFFMLDQSRDKAWLVNYMFINFEKVYTNYQKPLFDAFADIIENEVLDDYIGPIKKIHYNDLELEAKSFNVEAFRVMLLFTQTHEHFIKIADYVMNHNRSQLLVYLKKENDNNSTLVDALLDEISEAQDQELDTVKEIIKQKFNQYNDILVKKCESSIINALEDDNILGFGDIADLLGEESSTTQTFSIEVDQDGINEMENKKTEREQSRLNMIKKGIGAKVNLMINEMGGQGQINITSNFSDEDLEQRDEEINSQKQVDNLAINNVLSNLASSMSTQNKEVKILSGKSPVSIDFRKNTLVKSLRSNYERMDEGSPRDGTSGQKNGKQFELII